MRDLPDDIVTRGRRELDPLAHMLTPRASLRACYLARVFWGMAVWMGLKGLGRAEFGFSLFSDFGVGNFNWACCCIDGE